MGAPLEKLHGLRILVAEDETLVLMEIEDMLRELGCEIIGPASTVAASLVEIEVSALDGALLDMNLHGERILPAIKKLLAQGVPFLLVSGYAGDTGDEPELKHAKAQQTLQPAKPGRRHDRGIHPARVSK